MGGGCQRHENRDPLSMGSIQPRGFTKEQAFTQPEESRSGLTYRSQRAGVGGGGGVEQGFIPDPLS